MTKVTAKGAALVGDSYLRALYGEVAAHLESCELKTEYLSDTWSHTLKQKGRLHAFEDLLSMLAAGNRVNSWIDDFNYLNDETVVDSEDARAILARGLPEFGAPRKQLQAGGRQVSCQFVQQAVFAGRLIEAIDARGISEPVVMEIGGGLGGLARILRAHYGDRLTYYAVDLPETLAIQEWYLRGCFPEAPTAFKAGRTRVEFKRGGLNFVNAYALETQEIALDVAVNIDSMQEMNAGAVRAYLRYLEANISERGLFYFQNHFGHSATGIREPSEYPLDPRWTVAAAQVVPQIEVCSEGIQLRMILHRTRAPEDPATRRLVLRALWNAFMSGLPAHSPRLVSELAALPASQAPAAAAPKVAEAFRRHGVPLDAEAPRRLLRSPYWAAPREYPGTFDRRPAPGVELTRTLARADGVWRAQAALLALMSEAAASRLDAGAAAEGIARLVEPLPRLAEGSDYWAAYVAAILLALRQESAGRAVLGAARARSRNPHWLVRFAYLADRFGLPEAREEALAALGTGELDYFVGLKAAELAAVRSPERAAARIEAALARAGGEPSKLWPLARTAARLGRTDLAAKAARAARAAQGAVSSETVLGVLRACPPGTPRAGLEGFARSFEAPVGGRLEEDYAVFHGFVLAELGERERGLELARRAVRRFRADYFRLGQLGRQLQGAGRDDLADLALERSLALRPGTFLHHDFIGDVYFSARRYAPARRQFEAALRLRPYPRHIQAKRLYCILPQALRELGTLGRPSDWSLIFQRRHDFYHDIGPSTK